MPHGKAFASVKLQGDGTVVVTGPFTRGPGEAARVALVAFYLVQGSTKVDGDGRWLPGKTEWTGTADKGLTAGPAHGTALAVSPHDDGPGFVTFSWNEPVDVTEAQ
jgi:hypothetical protein